MLNLSTLEIILLITLAIVFAVSTITLSIARKVVTQRNKQLKAQLSEIEDLKAQNTTLLQGLDGMEKTIKSKYDEFKGEMTGLKDNLRAATQDPLKHLRMSPELASKSYIVDVAEDGSMTFRKFTKGKADENAVIDPSNFRMADL